MTNIKLGFVICQCTAQIPVKYVDQLDVINNRVDCKCGRKFFPKSVWIKKEGDK